jgi:DREV methyltransferase
MDIEMSETYSYNQKEVLKETIVDFISGHNIQSMLDVGAGWTDTALPYRNFVKNYLAVEQDKERAEMLKKSGIAVMNESFPCAIEDKFDLVLSSHSLPEQVEAYEAFLKTAWNNVNEKGYLIIITFKGSNETLWNLHDELVLAKAPRTTDEQVKEMNRILQNLGDVMLRRVTSRKRTKVPEDIAQELSWSFHLDYAQWKGKLLSVLEKRFKDKDDYFFPHEHLVILLKK